MATSRKNDKKGEGSKEQALDKPGQRALSHESVPVALATSNIDNMVRIIQDNLGSAGQLSIGDLTRLTVPPGGGTAWEIPNPIAGSKPRHESELDVVIVFSKDQKAFWKEPIGKDGGGGSPPDCRSTDMIHGVGDPGGYCNGGVDAQPEPCPFNVFGSANEGEGEGKACKDLRFLFILEGKSRLPKLLVVPPTSLKAVRRYYISLAESEMQYTDVVTRLELETDKNAGGVKYSRIVPKAVAELSDEEKATALMYRQALEPMVNAVRVSARKEVESQ
jgi:hypothetical protein